jgi:predicted phosphoribosyltransferase
LNGGDGPYCAGRPPLEITGRTAIVVDDGIATGATMQVAIRIRGGFAFDPTPIPN